MEDVSEAERIAARGKSYIGASVLVFFLYWLFWIPGLVVNYLYFREAKHMERMAGRSLPGAGCLLAMLWLNGLALVGAGLALWGFLFLWNENPAIRSAYSQVQLLAKCQIQLKEIGGALRRYESRHGKFPASLEELYPNFLENRAMLHCPADKRDASVVSYGYTPPGPDAPGSTKVAACRLHVLVEGQPPVVVNLTKEGKVVSEERRHRGGPLTPR